jgi:hypothetical protein
MKNATYTGSSILFKVPVVLQSFENMYLIWVDVEYMNALFSSK